MTTRRGFIKSLVALAAARAVPIPRAELRSIAAIGLEVPVGYILQMFDANKGIVHIIKTDHGFEELIGGVLSRERFPDLFNVIGTIYGAGLCDGATFSLPDFRKRPL